MKMKGYKRILAWILSMAMLVSSISFSAYAEDDGEMSIDPWQAVEDLRASWDEQEAEYQASLEGVETEGTEGEEAIEETEEDTEETEASEGGEEEAEETEAPEGGEEEALDSEVLEQALPMFTEGDAKVFNANDHELGSITADGDAGNGFTFLVNDSSRKLDIIKNTKGTAPDVVDDPVGPINVGAGEEITFTRHLLNNGAPQPTSQMPPLNRALKVNVTGPATITYVTQSNSATENREFRISNSTDVLHKYSTPFSGDTPTVKTYEYPGDAGTLYFYGGASLRIYYIRVDEVSDGPVMPDKMDVFNANDHALGSITADGDAGNGFTFLVNDSSRKLDIIKNTKGTAPDVVDDPVGPINVGAGGEITFTRHLLNNGAPQPTSQMPPLNRALKVDVTGPATITYVTQSNSATENREFRISNSTDVLHKYSTPFSGDTPTVKTYEYPGDADTLYFYGGASLRIYYISVEYYSEVPPKPDKFTYEEVNSNLLSVRNFTAEIDINDSILRIHATPSSGVSIMDLPYTTEAQGGVKKNVSAISVGLEDNIDFRRTIRLGGEGSMDNNSRLLSVPVEKDARITIFAASTDDGATDQEETLVVSEADKTIVKEYPIYGPNQPSFSREPKTFVYEGDADRLYFYSKSGGMDIFYIRVSYNEPEPTFTPGEPKDPGEMPDPSLTAYANISREGWKASAFGSNVSLSTVDTTVQEEPLGSSTVYMKTKNSGNSSGKIARNVEGLVLYYQEVGKTESFMLKAAANPLTVVGNNQVGFGLTVRNDVMIDVTNGDGDGYGENSVNAGVLRVAASLTSNSPPVKAFIRGIKGTGDPITGTHAELQIAGPESANTYADLYFPQFADEKYTVPAEGNLIDLSIKKIGKYVELRKGDAKPVILDTEDVYATAKGTSVSKLPAEPYNMFTNDTIYAGLFVSRAAEIVYSGVELDRYDEPSDVRITAYPEREFVYRTDFDNTGMVVEGLYNGVWRELSEDEYLVSGFDSSKTGNITLHANVGYDKYAEFTVTIIPAVAEKLTVQAQPIISSYFLGDKFETDGLAVAATYNSNLSNVLDSENYELKIGNEVITDGYVFNSAGEQVITVTYIPEEGVVETSRPTTTFSVYVSDKPLQSIGLYRRAAKQIYYLDEKWDPTGLLVKATYEGGETVILRDSEYTVTSASDSSKQIDTSKVGTTTVIVTHKGTTFTMDFPVKQRIPEKIELTKYPKTTYDNGEGFNLEGAVVSIVYDSGDREEIPEFAKYVEGVDKYGYYVVDSSAYNKDANGIYDIIFTYKGTVGTFAPVTVRVTVRNPRDLVWKSAGFGQSVSSSKVSLAPIGQSKGQNAPDVDPSNSFVRLDSWDGQGKITGDHDGIAFYYTKVPTSDNFTITADVTVKRFMQYGHVDNNDSRRHGQEAFGIMARDSVPFAYRTDKNGTEMTIYEDMSGNEYNNTYVLDGDGNAVIEGGEPKFTEEAAAKIASGELEPRVLYSVMDRDDTLPGYNKDVKYNGDADTDTPYASNIIIAGAHPDSSFPGDPSVVSYKRNATKNRIRLEGRKGVTSPNDGGSMLGPFKSNTMATMDMEESSDKWGRAPMRDDQYKITLQKTNSGFRSVSKMLKSGLSTDHFKPEDVTEYEANIYEVGLLNVQDTDYMYVGFFAARWATIDVDNIEITLSDSRTDAPYDAGLTAPKDPNFTVNSLYYTPYTSYNLMLKSNCQGFFNITKDGEMISRDLRTTGEVMTIPTVLKENSTAKFTVTFRPDELENLTTYEMLSTSFEVKHQIITDAKEVFVSVDGTQNAAGTREDPIDLDTAISFIKPGQKIIMLPGVYRRNGNNVLIHQYNKGRGTGADDMKYLWADEVDTVTIDLQKQGEGIILSGSYWHIKGIKVTRSADNAKPFHIGGSYNIVERVTSYNNGDTGLQISRTDSSDRYTDWPAHNLILNCESYSNRDASDTNADGFACKLTVGDGNVFRGCISHNNIDDGWDLYTKIATGAIGQVIIEDCISYRNGYIVDSRGREVLGTGDRNGFKIGGENVPVQHILRNCLTFNNGKSGVSSNSNPTGTIQNVTSVNNDGANLNLYTTNKDMGMRYTVDGFVSYRDQNFNVTEASNGDWLVGGVVAKANTNNKSVSEVKYTGPPKDNFGNLNFDANGNPVFTADRYNTVKPTNFFIWTKGKANLDTTTFTEKNMDDPENGWISVNSAGEKATADLFTSVDLPSGAIWYSRNADDTINHNGLYELKNGPLYIAEATEAPTATQAPGSSSSSSGGGGGGGSSAGTDSSSTAGTGDTGGTSSGTGGNTVVPKVTAATEVSKESLTTMVEAAKKAGETAIKVTVAATVSESGEKANSFEAKLPAIALADKEMGVTVEVPSAEIKIPGGIIDAKDLKDDSVVTIEIDKAEVTDVDESVRDEFGENIISVRILLDGKAYKVENLKEPIVVTVDYVGDVKAAHKVVVYYVNPSNKKEIVKNGMYDAVTNKVRFKTNHLSTFAFEESTKTFEDIQNAWHQEYVELLAVRGIINGTTDATYAPNNEITRSDFVKILVGVLDKVDTSGGGFTDINGNDYYYNEVLTAKALGLVSGMTATTFGPKDKITRQDMMVIIDKTLGYMGVELTAKDNLAGFRDADAVSGYALESVQKLVGAGIISGSNGQINPKATLTRAEAAKVLADVFLQSVK